MKANEMKKGTMTIALLAALLLVGTAIAQPAGNSGRTGNNRNSAEQRPGGNFFQRIRPMLGILELSDDQREDIASIIQDADSSIQSIREAEEHGTHREDFLEMFSSSSITVTEVESLFNERMEIMEEINRICAVALVDIHDVLTPEQLAMLADFEPGSMEMRNHEPRGANGRGMERGNGRDQGMNMGVHPIR